MRLWDLSSGEGRVMSKPTSPGHYLYSVAFHPDGRSVAVGMRLGAKVRRINVATGRELTRSTMKALRSETYCLAFTPDGRRIVGATRVGNVYLWDANTGREMLRFPAHVGHAIHDLAISPNGSAIATAGYTDGTVKLWEAVDWEGKAKARKGAAPSSKSPTGKE